MIKEAKLDECDDPQRHVVLVFDEMKINEDLVYKKNSGEVIGFVNMENVNDQLSELEEACKAEKPQGCKTDAGVHGQGYSNTWNFLTLISPQLTSPQIAS